MPLPSSGNIAIPAIETIANPKKTRIALVQGPQLVSAPVTAVSDALGLPAGGTTGQVLTKTSDTDYDTEWSDTGDFSGPASAVDGDFVAFDGTTGKLGKDSGKKASDFATAAQGALADSATQPGDLATVATSGAYSDLTGKPTLREVLTSNRTYYVRTTGSDSNDGLTSGNAFLTVQQAVNVALGLDMSIYAVTIDIGSGTFSEGLFLSIAGNGNARITLQGAGYTSTTISGSAYSIQAKNGVSLTLADIALQGTSVGLWVRYGAQVFINGSVSLTGGTARLLGADNGAYFECVGSTRNLYLGANSAYAFYADAGGHILIGSSATVLTTAARSFSSATARAQSGGVLDLASTTFNVTAGAVTGSRYSAVLNGVINTSGGGASYIPGSTAGSTATGGQYA